MNALFTTLTVLIVIAAVLLILVVLLQNGKGEGLASNFTAGNQTFGVRRTADILEKITWGLVIFIGVVSIIASFTMKPGDNLAKKAAETQEIGNMMPESGAGIDLGGETVDLGGENAE